MQPGHVLRVNASRTWRMNRSKKQKRNEALVITYTVYGMLVCVCCLPYFTLSFLSSHSLLFFYLLRSAWMFVEWRTVWNRR